MLELTILTENSVRRPGLLAEHGLSLWLELPGSKILFDAGQSTVFLHNAGRLGIDLGQADGLVLSHGHYDHGNGFAAFPAGTSRPKFFVHPDAFASRYAVAEPGGSPRPVGLGWQPADLPYLAGNIHYNKGSLALAENVWLCSEIKSNQASPGFLLKKPGEQKPDPFLDEQVLIIRQKKGLVIIFGCCHPGLATSLAHLKQLFPDEPIQAILGGLHLGQASIGELADLAAVIKELDLQYLIPLHCSGTTASCYLKEVFGERCLWLRTGDRISFL